MRVRVTLCGWGQYKSQCQCYQKCCCVRTELQARVHRFPLCASSPSTPFRPWLVIVRVVRRDLLGSTGSATFAIRPISMMRTASYSSLQSREEVVSRQPIELRDPSREESSAAHMAATSCLPGDAFVTFFSSGPSSYAPGVLCLQQALRAHHPQYFYRALCPLLVVVDDRPELGLAALERNALESKLTPPNRLINLTALFRGRLNQTAYGFYDLSAFITGNGAALSNHLDLQHEHDEHNSSSNVSSQRAAATKRTIHDYVKSWLKVWVWAIPAVGRAVFLGCDTLVQGSLDSLFNRT